MYDEKLACAIMHGFTKGYGKVPIKTYDLILPLLFNETFNRQLVAGAPLHQAVKLAVESGFGKRQLEQSIEKYQNFTSKILGICMLNKLLEFNICNGVMHGSSERSTSVIIKEAMLLGQYVKDRKYYEIVQLFNQNQEQIVFLDAETLGEEIDVSCWQDFGQLEVLEDCPQAEIAQRISEATVVITNKKILGSEELQRASKLRLICVTATGFNNIDIEYCKEHNITVSNVKGYSTNSVAQHTFAMFLDIYHKNRYYHDYVASGKYSSSSLFTHFDNVFYELEGKTWGIVGMGDIGQKVAKIAEAFGCKVQYFSTSGKNTQQSYPNVSFKTLLTTSDIISIHAPLNVQTEHLFEETAFSQMKRGSYLINVGRGSIIKESALVAALTNHTIAGACLDVFEQEPLGKHSPLLKIPASRLRMTPHIAWATYEARERVVQEVYKNIQSFLKGTARNVC